MHHKIKLNDQFFVNSEGDTSEVVFTGEEGGSLFWDGKYFGSFRNPGIARIVVALWNGDCECECGESLRTVGEIQEEMCAGCKHSHLLDKQRMKCGEI